MRHTVFTTIIVVMTLAVLAIGAVAIIAGVKAASAPSPAQSYVQCLQSAVNAGNDPAVWCTAP